MKRSLIGGLELILLATLVLSVPGVALAASGVGVPVPGVATTERIALPEGLPASFQTTVHVGGELKTLALSRDNARAPGFRVLAPDGSGTFHEVAAPPCSVYTGVVEGDKKSVVIATLLPEGLRVRVLSGNGRVTRVEPLSDKTNGIARDQHRVYDAADLEPRAENLLNDAAPLATVATPASRVVAQLLSGSAPSAPAIAAAASAVPGSVIATGPPYQFYSVVIAYEADYTFQQRRNFDLARITADAESYNAEVDLTYTRDALTRHYMGTLVLGAQSDLATGTPDQALNDFAARWNTYHADIVRDAAALLCENLGSPGGIGSVRTLGTGANAYCASLWVDGNVLVHELGHCWGAADLSDPWLPGHAMNGNDIPRWLGPTLHDIVLTRRLEGFAKPATKWPDPIEPYAGPGYVAKPYDFAPVTIDVLANDHDANDEAPLIGNFGATTQMGSTLTRSVGTGPGGRDQMLLTQSPLLPVNRDDQFSYSAADAGGLQSRGARVLIQYPPGLERTHFQLDGDLTDTAGYCTGSFYGNPTWGPGRFGRALQLDGTDWVDTTPLNLRTNTVTYVGWVKRNGLQRGLATVFGAVGTTDGGYDQRAELHFRGNSTLGYAWENTEWSWDSSLTVPDGQWTLVALVIEPTQATIYTDDGALHSSVHVTTHSPLLLGQGRIGAFVMGGPGAPSINGSIDDVRVYTYALSAQEISSLYDKGSLPAHAECPMPADGGRAVDFRPTTLAWQGAAQSFDVYAGTDWSAVNAATHASPEFKGSQSATSYAMGYRPQGTTLYWRVDSVNGGISTKGEVWRFTVGNGLRGYWKFDDGSGTSAVDSSGRNCTGTVNGATWTTGRSDGALAFSGSSSVTMGVGPALAGKTDFTVGAWIKTTSAAADGVIIQQRDLAGYWGEYMFKVKADGTLDFMIYGDNDYQFPAGSLTSAQTVNDGVWHHVVAVRSGGNGYLYRDGVRIASAAGTARSLDPSLGVVVGADSLDNSRFFNGTIDDVRIYDAALNDQEVKNLYARTQCLFPTDGSTTYDFRPTTLSWAGSATSYNVYTGTDWTAVANATTTSPEFKGSQATTSYAMRFLPAGTTYYWRIDPVFNGAPSRGDVWRFTVSNGLQAYWKFNEGTGGAAYDSSGRGCTGWINGPAWTTGTSGTALSFDGVTGYVIYAPAASLAGKTDFSVAAWVNTTSTAEGDIIEQGGGGTEGQYVLQLFGDGTANFMVYGQGTYQFNFHTTQPVNTGTWRHVAAVRSGTTGYLYIDGSRVASATGTAVSLDPALSVRVGADPVYTNKYFKGKIDDVRIYNTALSDQEVKDVRGWGPDKTPPTPNPMTWTTSPSAAGTSSIAMTATAASDPSGVQYYFTCASGGGHSSGWQTGRTYTDTGLSPNTRYTYTVKARDVSYYNNETQPSASAGATTASTYYPSSYQVIKGTYSSGTTQSLVNDDNNYLVINSQTNGSPRYATTDTTATNIPVSSPAKIDVKVITKSSVSSTTQKIRLYNFATKVWDEKDSITNLSTAELARTFSITSGTSNYVSQGKLRLETEGSKSTSFSLSHEVVQVTITP